MLMPAAVLVMVVLGAIAVDRAIIFGAQRDLVATAQAAANDASSLGVDIDALRSDGEVVADLQAMEAAVELSLSTADPVTSMAWWLDGDRVVVRLERRVDLVFTPAVPGAASSEVVTATASAELRLSEP